MAKRYLHTPEEVIDALQAGKKVETEDLEYKFINGILVATSKTNKHWIVYPALSASIDHYINESKSLKLEVGKFYRTRRGDKVVCLCHRGDYYIHRLNSYIVGYWVDKTGRALFNGIPERTETDSDVVELWEDKHK